MLLIALKNTFLAINKSVYSDIKDDFDIFNQFNFLLVSAGKQRKVISRSFRIKHSKMALVLTNANLHCLYTWL